MKRLLIVDDEPELAEALALHCRATGRFQVETAYSGEAALERLESDPPDAILLDVILPGISGWELCRRLRERESSRSIEVVVMTAWLRSRHLCPAGNLGVRSILLKPFDEAELDAALGLPA